MIKPLNFILLLIFSTHFVFGQNIKKLDEKNGFKEITLESFHQDVKQYLASEPEEVSIAEKTATYKVTDPSFFTVGESEISSVQVLFFKDKVASIMLETKGLQHSKALLKAFTLAYGNGEKRNTYIEEYHWNGKKVTMSYKMNGVSKNTITTISSKELLEANEKYKKDLKKTVTKEL